MSDLKQEYEDHQCWGMVASIDLYECNREAITTPDQIKNLIEELCNTIKMVRFGPPLIQRFAEGELEGYSAMQFIETSSITMHFDEVKNRAFIDVFSCKFFEPQVAEECCQKILGATRAKTTYYFRY
jgi:S-adenosylmethionine/arginine decarboxylase-like enzyme